MLGGVDIRDVAGCSCLRLRRAARRVTALYEEILAPSGLTIAQVGLLSYLYGTLVRTGGGLAVNALARVVDIDPTTLNRNLKPLRANGFVATGSDRKDRRIRTIRITKAGRTKLAAAIGLWRQAEDQLKERLGPDTATALGEILDRSTARLSSEGTWTAMLAAAGFGPTAV